MPQTGEIARKAASDSSWYLDWEVRAMQSGIENRDRTIISKSMICNLTNHFNHSIKIRAVEGIPDGSYLSVIS